MRLEGAHMLRARVSGRQPELRTIGALGRSRRFVVLGLCLLSVYAAFGLFAGAAEAATPSGALGALNGASDTATPFSALQRASLTANSSPDPSLVGSWSVTSSCSGSPCGDTLDISIGGQQASDPACSANEYCITTASGFYAKDVSATPNGGGSWTYTCDGCTGSEDISVTFKGDTFTGMATGIAPDGSVTGTVPYSGSCTDCVADQTHEVSGTLTNNNCGCSSVPTPEPQDDVTVNVASDDGAGVSASGTSNDKGVWSVDVPDGDYTVTPDDSTYSWNPTSQQVTVDGADKGGVNFDTCGIGDPQAGARDARAATSRPGPECTLTTAHCTSVAHFPNPSDCVVTVAGVPNGSSVVTSPQGSVKVFPSGAGSFLPGDVGTCGNLRPLATGSGKSTCSFSVVSPPGKQDVFLAYDPVDTLWQRSTGVGHFTVGLPQKISTKKQLHDLLTLDAQQQIDLGNFELDLATGPGTFAGAVSLIRAGKGGPQGLVAAGTVGMAGFVEKYGVSNLEVGLAGLLKDPPDNHYRILPKPHPSLTVPKRYRHVFDQRDATGLYRAAADLQAQAKAASTAVNRATTAAKAGATKYRDLQVQATIKFLRQMAADTHTIISDQIRLANAVARTRGGHDRLRFKSSRFRREFRNLTVAQLIDYPPEIAALRHLASLELAVSQNPAPLAFPKLPALFP